tara:strand:+ start:734 stop:1324 length:591 start_codon:yes stop_codon:yes gene_type:complete
MKNSTQQLIKKGLNESIEVKLKILNSNLLNQIEKASELLIKCLQNGGKIFFAGNGGSFADSQHLATEFISRFLFNRGALPAIALGTNSSSMSAIANDYNFKDVFSRELEALASKKDIFIPITTSGNSINLIEAVKVAKIKEMKIMAFTGETGGALNDLCECIKVPSTNVARIQECHILIGHLFCQIVEENIFHEQN